MILSFHPCFSADHQIILGDRSLNSDDLSFIKEARVILLPQSCPIKLYCACKNSFALLFPNYETRFEYPGKIGQSIFFKKAGCPHPETIPWNSVDDFREACRGSWPHDIPFLIKRDKSHEADGIYLIEDSKTLESALDNLSNGGGQISPAFISQELIPTSGNVLRVVVIGLKMITYWKRAQNFGQIITTIRKGAKIDMDWRIDLQEKGRILTQKFSDVTGINLAAVDIVFPFNQADPEPLFIEINYYFGRRGLGGSLKYYRLLFEAIRKWLFAKGFDPKSIKLV